MVSILIVFAFGTLALAAPDLEVSSLLLKVSLKGDESLVRTFTVTSPDGADYNLEVAF